MFSTLGFLEIDSALHAIHFQPEHLGLTGCCKRFFSLLLRQLEQNGNSGECSTSEVLSNHANVLEMKIE